MSWTDRFNNPGYKNWLRVGIALLATRDGLKKVTLQAATKLHAELIAKLGDSVENCTCNPKKGQDCEDCKPWRQELETYYTGDATRIGWTNCTPSKWSKEPWEVAKVFMPKGKTADNTGPEKSDVSALLNFLAHCKYCKQYVSVNPSEKVIEVRNEAMHSKDLTFDRQTFNEYMDKMDRLLRLVRDPLTLAADITAQEAADKILKVKKGEFHIGANRDCLDAEVRVLREFMGEQEKLVELHKKQLADHGTRLDILERSIPTVEEILKTVGPILDIVNNNPDLQHLKDQAMALSTMVHQLQDRLGKVEGAMSQLEETVAEHGTQIEVNTRLHEEISYMKDKISDVQQNLRQLKPPSGSTSFTPESDEQTSAFTGALAINYSNTLKTLKPLPWDDRFCLDLDKIFTRLVLVGHNGHEDRGITFESLDEVFDYLPISNDEDSRRFNVLVVGDAGSGKSTLFSKAALDWSRKKGRLADMNKIVLLIRLREVEPGESIAVIVWDQCVTGAAKGISISSIETCLQDNESDVVFLLDGYDELVPGAMGSKQAIPELLAKKCYPDCTTIVTSRPSSGIERYMTVDCKVNVMGFSSALVDKYVHLYFKSVEKSYLADSLVKALDSKANIVARDLIQIPMFLMLICVLWEENPTIVQFPVTMSGLHRELLTCVIRKYCVREGLSIPNDENEIPTVVLTALRHLGKLALESLLRGENLVDPGKTVAPQDTEILLKLGIVSKEVSASRLHPREQLNFPHKSMQEFLAARYVADRVNTSSDDLHSLIPLDTLLQQKNLVHFIYDFGGKVANEFLQAGAVVKTGSESSTFRELTLSSQGSASVPFEVEMGGPELRALYDRACAEGYTEVYSTRFVLIGKFGNGKTNLCSSLLGEEFDPEWKITDNIAIHPCVMTHGQEWRKLEGQEDHFPHTVAEVMKKLKDEKEEDETGPKSPTTSQHDSDVTDRTEPEAVTTMGSENKREERPKPPTSTEDTHGQPDLDVLNTTAPDVHATTPQQAQIDKTPPKTFMKAADILRKQKGSEDQSNVTGTKEYPLVSIWDFGGQEIFYSTQQVFYTHRAIYGMVLDLTKPLDSSVEEMSTVGPTSHCRQEKDFIDYHLESIRAHTRPPVPHRETGQTSAATDIEPPVLVIFTKKDQVPQERKQQTFHSDTRNHLKGKVIDKHVIDRYFSVDNTKRNPEDPEVTELRKFILDQARKQSYMGERIPVKWLEIKSKLQDMHKEGKRYCTLQKVMEAIGSPPTETTPEENAVNILKFWHLCGDIIYFPVQNLRNFVILDPQWFVDVCKTIITIPQYRDREVKEDWDKLQETGELQDHLIEHVWRHREEALQYNLIEHKQELLSMMERFDLVLQCHGRSDEESGPKCDAAEEATYFIPCLLTTVTDEKKLYPPGTTRSKPIFIVFDGQFCPVGLYHRMVIGSMRRYFNVKPLAYASCARFITDNLRQTFIITKEKFFLKIELVSSVQDEANRFSHGPNVRDGIEEDLREVIDNWAPGIKYKWCLKCSCEGHKGNEDTDRFFPIEDVSATEYFKSGEVVCKTYAPATATVQDVGLTDWFLNLLSQPEDEMLSSADPSGQPSVLQDCFHMVVKEVCPRWRELGFRLKLSSANVDEIEERHRGDPRKCCRAVCDRWVQLNGSNATVDVLKDALISIREVPTADHIDDYLQQMSQGQPTQVQLQTGQGRGKPSS